MKPYLKMFVAAFLIFGAGSAVATEPDVYSNPTAGFQVTKPAEWSYITAAQNMDNIKAIKLSDEEFHAAMQKYATAPLVAMAKYQEPFDDVNPSFKVNLKPFGDFKGKPPQDIISFAVPQFKNAFKNFVLVQPPTEVVVSGIKSAYARMNYTIEVPDGRSFPITSELWIVPHGDYFFMIGAGTRQDEGTGSRKEIQNILSTLKIEQ
ncbi:hypothetical protein MIH18_11680 [Marinobacter sp. M3C]|uniref:hypothetical protein n=1 Tax=unclassified Marinobacter TaxID=83889 RepID=UPI00200F8F8C|nr:MULTISPECIES: hypothetical protein [unclassified Marinobacter]MCL1480494.1 hypothetical protein [Marinobacter sp.]MCL1487810.1 hypothetical protein [Marinobacter sp.]UQG56300.1 hypothetical protein MIH16_01085 [Marinobacter sp. M4C]UQG58429.1 hypothetical protein MIH18_11680 [Marinobacter sp. M3C]UQG65104.1 hypothetical protein MIH17_01085 [Marinobacter sp. M2C]